jgi:uncharacterized protein (TIGR00661 family)
MKILYAIQGTGNGHLSRARDVIPCLQLKGDVDILVSGSQADVDLPFPVKYRLKGLSFIFGKKGGVDLVETYKKGSLKRLYKEIKTLAVSDYDIVINDFEPVSAWACYLKHKSCISLSHQSAVLNKKAPKPAKSDAIGKAILKNYAPVSEHYGFHFKTYDANIFTPVIRQQVRDMYAKSKDHYTVYLPAYDDETIINILKETKNVNWEIFSKHTSEKYSYKNFTVKPVTNDAFLKSLATCKGILCGAGFETPAEAIFLKKKLMVIPMKNQYEQQCNAAALKQMEVPVIKSLKKKYIPEINDWIKSDHVIHIAYENNLQQVIDLIFETHASSSQVTPLLSMILKDSKKSFLNKVLLKSGL